MKKIFKPRKNKSILSIMIIIILMLSSLTSFAEALDRSQGSHQLLKEKISTEVSDRFKSGEEKVEVLIKLKEQTDTEAIADREKLELSYSRFDSSQIKLFTREAVIEALEYTAERTQYELLQYLESESTKGNVEGFESYYIINMVYVKATEEIINNIALMDDIEMIYFNEKIYLNDYTIDTEGIIEIIEEEEAEVREESFKEIMAEDDINLEAVLPSDIEWNIKIVNADKVWNTYGIDGTGVVVGMIDTGVAWDHPALKNKYRGYNTTTGTVNHSASWYDAYGGRTTPYDDSQAPHGSHVMGTILGQESTGKNAIGVAPGAKFIVAKALSASGGSSNQLLAAGQWMLKPGGSAANAPDIINNSWGGGNGVNDWYREVVRSWRAAGIVPVFAAGNQRQGESAPVPGSIELPSSYPESFAVAATDSSNRRGSFSKLGPSPYGSNIPKPDISAPGVSIRSSVPSGYEGGWSGTSMAAPNIAGVAALILQANPNLSVAQVENTIKNTATPLTDTTYRTSPNMGYGYGLVNAFKAVESIKGSQPQPVQTGTVIGRVTNYNTGSSISGARVSINGTSLYAYSDVNGYFTLNSVPAGTQIISISSYGYNTVSGSIVVTEGKTINVTVRLTPSGYYYNSDDEIVEPEINQPVEDNPIIELPITEPPKFDM